MVFATCSARMFVYFDVPHFNSLPPVVISVEAPVYKPTKMNERSQEILNAGG